MPDAERIRAIMTGALRNSLEEMAFAEVVRLDEATRHDPDFEVPDRPETIWATVPFVSPLQGKLTLVISPALGRTLTEMIYGMLDEGSVNDEVVLDALSEATNVISGRFMNGMLEGDVAFELGLPDRGTVEDEVPPPEERSEELDFAVEGHRVTIRVEGEQLFA